jgi:RimJ/RimL family protein N-acetyltransferase
MKLSNPERTIVAVTLRTPAAPTGPALTLRPWSDADLEPLVTIHQDPAMRRWTRTHLDNKDTAAHWLAIQRDGWRSGTRLSFAVHNDDGQLVACVVVKHPPAEPAEVGYWTAAFARGQGIASRALDTLSTWAFATLGLTHLNLVHQADNEASCRVAEKAGYAFTGILPAAPPYPLDGHLHVRHPQSTRHERRPPANE